MINIRKIKFLRRKSIFGKLIRLPFKLIPAQATLTIFAGPLKGRKWIKGSHNISVWLGRYEIKQTKLFVQESKQKKVLWDLGAHVGYYSLLFKSQNEDSKVYAFEPVLKNVKLLQNHLTMNSIEGVAVFQKAVSNELGTLKFNSSRTSVAGKLHIEGDIEVEVIKLSFFLENETIASPDIIKMDIEGEELKVLKDLQLLLARQKPIIFLSTHGKDVHDQCCVFLKSIGYDLLPLDADNLAQSREIFCQSL